MKKKFLLQKSLVLGILLGIMFCTSNAFSQGINWRLNGNNNVKKMILSAQKIMPILLFVQIIRKEYE